MASFSGTLHGRLVVGFLAGERFRAVAHVEERPARGCVLDAGAGHPDGRGAHVIHLAGAMRHVGTGAGDDSIHGGRGRAGEGGRGAADLLELDGVATAMPGKRRVDDTAIQPSLPRDQCHSFQHSGFQREPVRTMVRAQAKGAIERLGDLGRETRPGTRQSMSSGDDHAGDSSATSAQI